MQIAHGYLISPPSVLVTTFALSWVFTMMAHESPIPDPDPVVPRQRGRDAERPRRDPARPRPGPDDD
jgi:hypothetical protein